MKKSEAKISFNIYDFDCVPADITKQLGIAPDFAGVVGDPMPVGAGKTIPLRHNLWSIESSLDAGVPLEDHLEHLLAKLEKYSVQLKKLTARYEANFVLAMYYYEVNPGFFLEKTLLKRIADLNIGLDFDIYCLGSGD